MGLQAMIESYNGWWQARVWSRFQHADLADLQQPSGRQVRALRQQRAARLEADPKRRPFPAGWELDLKKRLRGRLIYLRRTNAQGAVTLLGRTWPVSAVWPSRLVRCEVDLDKDCGPSANPRGSGSLTVAWPSRSRRLILDLQTGNLPEVAAVPCDQDRPMLQHAGGDAFPKLIVPFFVRSVRGT
jgi:hypothetical protein